MNIQKTITVGIIAAVASALALDYVEVIDVKARQRYPWNGLVDIDFELDSKATEPYQMKVTVFDNDGKTNLPVKTVYTEGVSFSQNPTMVKSDTSRIIWDASADLPNGFKCTNVLVTCQDERTIDNPKRYMIIDLSAGANAVNFPVTYMNCPPVGGWTEDYKLTKLVLRRVEPGVFYMGSSVDEVGRGNDEVLHKVTLTKPFYIGIYEVTAKQFSLVNGGTGSDTQPVLKTWDIIRGYDVRGTSITNFVEGGDVDKVTITQDKSCSDYAWPNSRDVAPSSFIGKLRNKTSLNFDLPTEAQWEYACRGGTSLPLNIGTEDTMGNRSKIQGDAKKSPNGDYWIYVGNYMPNSLGIYDMIGNVSEWCLDRYVENLGESDCVDPIGGGIVYETVTSKDSVNSSALDSNVPWWQFQFIFNAQGIRRVIRGSGSRCASRSSTVNFNLQEPICAIKRNLTSPYVYGCGGNVGDKIVLIDENKTAGIRIAVTVDE